MRSEARYAGGAVAEAEVELDPAGRAREVGDVAGRRAVSEHRRPVERDRQRSGSRSAKPPFNGAEPAAASTRPQFGSRPNAAVLTSGEVAIRRAIASASRRRHRAGDLDLEHDGRALAVRDDLRAPDRRRPRARARRERVVVPRDPARAVREQDDGIVRRAVAVDRDPVERSRRRPDGETLRLARLERVVGREDGEHRGKHRVDHPRALRHPTDDEAAGPCRDRRLGPGIGGHDRARGGLAAIRGESAAASRDAGQQLVHRQVERRSRRWRAQPPGRARARAPRRAAKAVATATAMPCAPVAAFAFPALITTACGCAAARCLLRDDHRCGLHPVRRPQRGADGGREATGRAPRRAPDGRMPAATPAQRTPGAAVTDRSDHDAREPQPGGLVAARTRG